MQPPAMVLPQTAGNLGKRLNALDYTLRDKGVEQLVYIGSDAPGLTAVNYIAARNALHYFETVLMPATEAVSISSA